MEQFHSRYTQRECIFAQLFLKKSCTSQFWLGHSNCETALNLALTWQCAQKSLAFREAFS